MNAYLLHKNMSAYENPGYSLKDTCTEDTIDDLLKTRSLKLNRFSFDI